MSYFSIPCIFKYFFTPFIIFDYQKRAVEAFQDLGKWIAEGKIKYKNDIVPGLENASSAIKKLFAGENHGKLIVQISEE